MSAQHLELSSQESKVKPSFELRQRYLAGTEKLFDLFQAEETHRQFLLCTLIIRNAKTLLSGGFGSGKNTFVEIAAKMFYDDAIGVIRCHPELTVFDVMWGFDVQKFITGKIGAVTPKPLITQPFKYLNEIQRLSAQCQNALLGLLTDKIVMFGDIKAPTPDYVAFLDRNPNDLGTVGMVKALMDRIDFYLDFKFLNLESTQHLAIKKYSQLKVDDLKAAAQPVMHVPDMMSIWDDVKRVTVSPDFLLRTSLTGILLRKCVRVDRAIASLNYRLSCDGCQYLPEVCNKLERPLGQRWLDSLVKLCKARAWVEKRPEVSFDDALWALPYVLPHRLDLKQNLFAKYPTEVEWVTNVLLPTLKSKQENWTTGISLLEPASKGDLDMMRKLGELKERDLAVSEVYEWALRKSGAPPPTIIEN